MKQNSNNNSQNSFTSKNPNTTSAESIPVSDVDSLDKELGAFIGLHTVPSSADDPVVSINFPVSLRIFVVAYALHLFEKNNKISEVNDEYDTYF